MMAHNEVLVDDRADDDVKATAISEWDALNQCCARPGLARSLRRQSISGVDLCHSFHAGILRGLAHSSRITVADCELRHARNRIFTNSNGRTGYASFCVSSVLDETKLLHKQSVEAAKERDCLQNGSQVLQLY